jgi:hypothetical protein
MSALPSIVPDKNRGTLAHCTPSPNKPVETNELSECRRCLLKPYLLYERLQSILFTEKLTHKYREKMVFLKQSNNDIGRIAPHPTNLGIAQFFVLALVEIMRIPRIIDFFD